MVGETSLKNDGKTLERTVAESYTNGNIATEAQKNALKPKHKPTEEYDYSNYSLLGGLLIDMFNRSKVRVKRDDEEQIVEEEPKTVFGRAYKWVGAKYHRVTLCYLTFTALTMGIIPWLFGNPIWEWETAETKSEARIEQRIEQYLLMDRHKVEARPIYSTYYNCITQDENRGMEALEEDKEAYRAAYKIINNLKNDTVPKNSWQDSPCNNPDHISEQVPAPNK